MYEKIITIGVLEESKGRNTFKLLKGLLTKSNFKITYENKKGNIIILNQNYKNIIVLDIDPSIVNSLDQIGLDFSLLIHTFLKADNKNDSLRNILHRSENIIINCDEEWIDLLDDNKESIAITYGFNNKATINPSSYNIHDSINANICFQREILTLSGEKIDPFEISIKINSIQKQDLYSAMGVIATGLILGLNNIIEADSMDFGIKDIIV